MLSNRAGPRLPLFSALVRMPTDNHKIVIDIQKKHLPDNRLGDRRFNVITSDEVASVIVGANLKIQDIILRCRYRRMMLYNILLVFFSRMLRLKLEKYF